MESSGLEAVAGPDATVLILGTLPGAESLEKRQYYAQPRNAFWSIMAEVAEVDLASPYEERLRVLTSRGIAIWDVCASAIRPGSLDAGIRSGSIQPNDFEGFLELHPYIWQLCFNGTKASALFEPRAAKVGCSLGWRAPHYLAVHEPGACINASATENQVMEIGIDRHQGLTRLATDGGTQGDGCRRG